MEGYNVTTMLKRLEAATSRLEDIVLYADKRPREAGNSVSLSPKSGPQSMQASEPVPPLPAKTSVNNSTEPTAASISPQQSAAVGKLRDLLPQLDAWVDQSAAIDPGLAEQAKAFRDGAVEMQKLVELAGTRTKPQTAEFAEMFTPLNQKIGLTDELRDVHRRNLKLTNFLATVPSGAPALGWISIEGKNQAASFIAEMRDSAKFYGNRVLKDGKEFKSWVDAFIGYIEALRAVVQSEFPEGLAWATTNSDQGAQHEAASTAAAAGPPPPPPPPPSVDQLTANLSKSPAPPPSSGSTGGGMNGVFDELAKGESIASSLKPTDRQALMAQKPPVPRSTKPRSGTPATASTQEAKAAKLHPRIELVESRWHIEDLSDRHDIEIQASMGQSVQIDNVTNCTIKILGKAATFSLSRSKKVGLLVETMVASTDVVNCSDFGIQVTGTLPSIMIDQSQHGSIYLSEDSLGVDIFTSQTTAINVNIPEGEPGAFKEVPLGEQIIHNVVGGSLKSAVVKHA